jgi:hypothetical protein
MNKVKRLLVYVDYVKNRISTTEGEKKAFFERELRKTMNEIERLTK